MITQERLERVARQELRQRYDGVQNQAKAMAAAMMTAIREEREEKDAD